MNYPLEYAVDVQWPSLLEVDFCGEKITDRECDKQSKKPTDSQVFNAKICFTAFKECPGDYKPDNGKVKGPNGDLVYGWGRDMTANTRDRSNQADPLLKSLILFPPDPKSV